jgi:DNA-binding NarL/FixJ family response regulator
VEPIRVLVADDHPLFRDGLRGLLASRDGFEVVGEAASGEEAVAVAVSAVPDVVVMDLHMPGLNGIHATRRIVAASPHTAVLVLTMFSDDDSVFAAMRAGARGYLLKGAGQVDIVQSIQAVARGEAVFGPAVANRVLVTSSRAAAWCLVWPQAVSLLRRCCARTDLGMRIIPGLDTAADHAGWTATWRGGATSRRGPRRKAGYAYRTSDREPEARCRLERNSRNLACVAAGA